MRCPYCGGLNAERAPLCAFCGRDLTAADVSAQHSSRQQSNPSQRSPQPPYQTQRPVQSNPQLSQSSRPVARLSPSSRLTTNRQEESRIVPSSPAAPEPPVSFPPRTIEQLKGLEVGALPYTVVSDSVENKRKKIIGITYQRCTAWQQVATLFKAFKEQQGQKTERFESIVIRGVPGQDNTIDTFMSDQFTNGQLRFDRNVRLGSQILNRYQIETENGFSYDAIRIVLLE